MELKNVLILDFDNTIYPNPTNDFSLESIDKSKILNRYVFNVFSYDFTYLITGRYNQKNQLRNLLNNDCGYYIDTIIDNPINFATYQNLKFIDIIYRVWKVNTIFQIITRNKFNSITIYDDNGLVLNQLKIFDNVNLFLANIKDKHNYEMIKLK